MLGDDPAVKQGKPHPDIFMEAAHRIATDPLHLIDYSKFLAFEDSVIGVTVRLGPFFFFISFVRFYFCFRLLCSPLTSYLGSAPRRHACHMDSRRSHG